MDHFLSFMILAQQIKPQQRDHLSPYPPPPPPPPTHYGSFSPTQLGLIRYVHQSWQQVLQNKNIQHELLAKNNYNTSFNLTTMAYTASKLTPIVLPEPVCAMPTKSLPDRAMGQPWAWIAVGSENCLVSIL